MRALALVAGVILVLLGIAGFAKMLVMAAVYSVVLVVAGIAFAIYGATHRSPLAPRPTTGRDLRNL